MDTGGSPRRQETMGGAPAQTRSERVLKQPNEPTSLKCHTSKKSGGAGWNQLYELMDTVYHLYPMIHPFSQWGMRFPHMCLTWRNEKDAYGCGDPQNKNFNKDRKRKLRRKELLLKIVSSKDYNEEELAELDIAQKEKQKQEEATNAALADEFDEIQARMDADHELAKEGKKQLAAKRAEAIRNKPPTRAQVRNRMITYLKHMDEDENYDIHSIYLLSIHRADGNTSYHKTFSSMLREFNKQDLMDLHRLVMKRFEDNTPEGYNFLLWEDLKVMFEPNAEDEIWKAETESTMAFELLKFIKSQYEIKADWIHPTSMFKMLKKTLDVINEVNIKFRGGLLGIMDFYNLVLLIQLDTILLVMVSAANEESENRSKLFSIVSEIDSTASTC
ncbi:hypothetical protein Tco_0692879 [Tanacetum coccineum]